MLIAESTTALSRLQNVPAKVWLMIAAAIVGLIVLVLVFRWVARMNKLILGIIVLLVVSFVGFNWLYERNEPAWATPVIDPLSKFFPTKSSMK